MVKDMRSVATQIKPDVSEAKGDVYSTAIDNYINRIANPDFYRTFDDLETISKTLRKNTAIAYLAYNVITVANPLARTMISLGTLVSSPVSVPRI